MFLSPSALYFCPKICVFEAWEDTPLSFAHVGYILEHLFIDALTAWAMTQESPPNTDINTHTHTSCRGLLVHPFL